jgi:NACalpha-BTF3-like transcription factor
MPGIITIAVVKFWKKYKKLGFIYKSIEGVNRLSVSGTGKTQRIEKPFNADNMHLDSQARFCCQD